MNSTGHEILTPRPVPDADGRIAEPGWAPTEIMSYTRGNIKAPWYRRKEWDYYLFSDGETAVAFTISDLGYAGLLSVSYLEPAKGFEHTETEIVPLPLGKKFGLGTTTEDASGECRTKRLHMVFKNVGADKRHLFVFFKNFDGGKDFYAELDVYRPLPEALYIATPWKEKPTAFYYNCKMNCLEAEGSVRYGDRLWNPTRETTLGCLDWGRGVWTYDNTWYWGTASARVDGEAFGFNLGYGFSDRSAASENAFYYKGKVHKLSEVEFIIPEDAGGQRQYTQPWTVTSSDGRLEAVFTPQMDRNALIDLKLIISDQHQVFGTLTGTAIMDDGEVVELKALPCAIEVVRNKY